MEGKESAAEALKRECLEEIGCDIKIGDEVGEIVEYRDKFSLRQNSFCFLAEVEGEKGKAGYTDEEIRDGFELMWLPIGEAIGLVKNDKPADYEGSFIVIRDLAFLQKAQEIL